MANKAAKNADNVAGKYYVDDQCTSCGICEGMAPDNFKLKDDGSYAYVSAQPTADQEAACKEAMESCPSSAIGDDGE
ncbi:MAG: ferredoxin [Candidatus Goldbacteria bacterium]|jgi:ferredoxin|nr:ferredoxin [Candidatus Goldiibacteriota bacterium]